MDLNYNPKIEQIQFSKIGLTLLGKITVIKSLMLSRITHLQVLTLLFYEFIWNGKRNKIKRTTLCKSLEKGGLNMVEINVFIDSLKVTWIRKMFKKDK